MSNTDKSVLKDRPAVSTKVSTSASAGDPSPQLPSAILPLASSSAKLQGLILTAGALILVYLIFALHQLLGAHSLFEAAQLQRVLNQRYAKEVLLASSGVPVNYEKTAKQWAKTHDVLAHGGQIPSESGDGADAPRVHPPAGVSKFASSLESLGGLRKRIVQESQAFMDSNRLSQHRDQLFDELYRQSLALQAAGDALVSTYDRHLNSGVSWWDVNAVAVELAERQRMLIQQHVKEVLFVAHGVPADYQATRLRLFETARILMEGGALQIEGGELITVPAPSSSDVRFNLEEQKKALDRFTAVSNQFLMLSNEDVERSIQLKKLSDLSAEFHASATGLLRDYLDFFSRKVSDATRNAVLAGVLAAVFALLLVWSFARKYVDLPAAAISAALRALRQGRRPERQAERLDPGPLSGVAVELDRCADAWETRRAWFDGFLTAERPEMLEDPGAQDPVAARLYEWFKTRPASDVLARPRWDDRAESGSDDITVVGHLPGAADALPLVNDAELLDQLIQRANELQHQNERLNRSQDELRSAADALREGRSADADRIARLNDENGRLRDEIAGQSAALADLRRQIEFLQGSESVVRSNAEEVQTLLRGLEERLSVRSHEIAGLERALQDAEGRLLREAAERSRALEDRSAEIDSLRSQTASLTRSLQEKERALLEMTADLDRSKERSDAAQTALALQEREIGSLRSAVRQNELEAERRIEEIELVKARHADETRALMADLDSMRRRMAELEAVSDDLRRSLAERDGSLKVGSERQNELLSRIGSLERTVDDLTGSRSELSGRHEELVKDFGALSEIKDRLEWEKRSLDADIVELRRQVEASAAARQADAERFERSIADLRDALRLESEAVLALRLELGQTLERHASDLADADARFRQAEKRFEDLEAQLWQSQRLLREHQDALSEARAEVARLLQVQSEQSALVQTLRSGIAGLEEELRSAEAELHRTEEERQRFERELAALKEAYFEKCQALASTEDRLMTTRAALKTTLEDLQERSKP